MKDADFDALASNGSTGMDGAMNSIVVAKLSSMAVLGITSFFLGILPIKLASCLRWKPTSGAQHVHGNAKQPLVISLLLCFGGGVLLYTVFMHLQPEVAEHMDAIVRTGYIPSWITETGLNLAQLVFCLGFFFVYLLEETVHVLLDKGHTEEDMEVLHRSLSLRKGCRGGNLIPRISLAKPGQTPPSTITASTQVLIRDGSYNSKKNVIDPIGNMSPAPTEPSETGSSSLNSDRPTTVGHSLRGFFAVLALSFHAVFEGLAVGLEKETANVWYLCAAIATHKLVIAFCVGVELVSSRTKTVLVVMYMAAFAVVSPLGIGIGLIITSEQVNPNSPSVALPSVVLQGMASGTLLYVVFFEVLQREKGNSKHGFSQLMAIITGFSVMIALSLFTSLNQLKEDNHVESVIQWTDFSKSSDDIYEAWKASSELRCAHLRLPHCDVKEYVDLFPALKSPEEGPKLVNLDFTHQFPNTKPGLLAEKLAFLSPIVTGKVIGLPRKPKDAAKLLEHNVITKVGHEHSHAHDLMDHYHNHHHDHHVHLEHDHDHDHGELGHT